MQALVHSAKLPLVSSQPVHKPATYQDLQAVPDHLVAEIIDGELITSPRPASPHARATSVIGSELMGPFDGQSGNERPGGWWILDEPELHLHDHILVPDIAGWRREKMPELPNVTAFTQPPDWVCEVISPATARHDRVKKTRIYAQHQVGHLWLIDPLARTFEVFELRGDIWALTGSYGGDEKVRAVPFDAIELDLSRLWLGPETP